MSKGPHLSGVEALKCQGAVLDSAELFDGMPHGLKKTAHFTFPPFREREPDQGSLRTRTQHAHAACRRRSVVQHHATRQPPEVSRAGPPPHPRFVDLLDPKPRMHQLMRQLAVIREKEESAGFPVKTAHRKDAAPLGGNQFGHEMLRMAIACRRGIALGLVKDEIHRWGVEPDGLPIERDAIPIRIDGLANRCHRTVDRDPTRRYERVGSAPRGNPGARQGPLNALRHLSAPRGDGR